MTDQITAALAEAERSLPPDIVINSELFRLKSFIDRGIFHVGEALVIGAVLVVIVLFLFLMNLRMMFITLTAIPLSLVRWRSYREVCRFHFLRIGRTARLELLGLLDCRVSAGHADDRRLALEQRKMIALRMPHPCGSWRVWLIGKYRFEINSLAITAASILTTWPILAAWGRIPVMCRSSYRRDGRLQLPAFEPTGLAVGFLVLACGCWPLSLRAESAGGDESFGGRTNVTLLTQPPELLPSVESETGLTLQQLEQLALGSNPSLGRAASLVGAARGNWVQVGLRPNPSVGYEGQQLGSGGLAEQHGVLFSQEIVRGGKLQLNRAVADRERMRLEQEFAAQELRVITDVRIAFYQALLAQRQIDLSNDLGRISDEGARTVDQLYRADEVGRADVLQAQLEIENVRILIENARQRHDSAWRSLSAVVGDPSLAPQPLAGDAESPSQNLDYQQSLERLLALSPEISAAATEVERARLALQRARVEPIPNVNVQGLVNWQDNGAGGKADGGVAVSIPIPLFNRNQGAIAQAEHELMAARQQLSETELSLQQRLAPIFELYANARHQVDRYRQLILPTAEESLLLSRQTYAAGETNYTSLLTAQRTYSQTRLNYLDALKVLRIAEAEIEGLLLRGSLQTSSGGEAVGDGSTIQSSIPVGGLELFRR